MLPSQHKLCLGVEASNRPECARLVVEGTPEEDDIRCPSPDN